VPSRLLLVRSNAATTSSVGYEASTISDIGTTTTTIHDSGLKTMDARSHGDEDVAKRITTHNSPWLSLDWCGRPWRQPTTHLLLDR
jgi:hypothetical protein